MERQRVKPMRILLDPVTFRGLGLENEDRYDRARAGFYLGYGMITIARMLSDHSGYAKEADDALETALALGMNDEDAILIRTS